MQLVAYMNGERVDATQMAHGPWRGLVNDPDYERLVLIDCGLRASRGTRRGRQFFKHYRVTDCTIEHKSESDQHLALKRALQDRINATDGWRAEVEHAHPEREWIADVMAIHTSGRRLAFEVQLSAQSEDEYIRRTQRYADDGIDVAWVVPRNIDWFRVKMPMIVTGFGKSSDLPGEPAELMHVSGYQPMFRDIATVGFMVDGVLHPLFRWRHGTPSQQIEELAALEEMKAKAVTEALTRKERLANEQRVAADKAALLARQLEAKFVESAAPLGIQVRQVVAGTLIWASAVRCMKAGHPMLIWRLTEPTSECADPWIPGLEILTSSRKSVDAWLAAAGSGLVKASFHRLRGFGDRSSYACPECKDVIEGRWVSALPPAKWSLIAEASGPRTQASGVLPPESPVLLPSPPAAAEAKPPTPPTETTQPRVMVEETEPASTGPRPWEYWMTEAKDGGEMAQRLAAKEAHAARMEQLRADPRYRVSPNGFRFECTDCGGEFEDDNEGIHTGARCIAPGFRRPGRR